MTNIAAVKYKDLPFWLKAMLAIFVLEAIFIAVKIAAYLLYAVSVVGK